MATTLPTRLVYIHVIQDVVRKVREEFINYGGPGESVLNELQDIWEAKLLQAGGITAPLLRRPVRNPTPPGGQLTDDLNVPNEVKEEYETLTTEMLFPPTPLQTPVSTPLPGTVDKSSMYNSPTTSSDYPTSGTENGSNADIRGRHSPYMPPPSSLANPRPDVNVDYMDGRDEPQRGNSDQQFTQDLFLPSGKRKRDDSSERNKNGGSMPQQDGASDAIPQANFECDILRIAYVGDRIPREFICSSSKIPQADGSMPDPYDGMLSKQNIYNYQGPGEHYNETRTPAPNEMQTSTLIAVQNDIIEDDEELLNEDDDDDYEFHYLENGEDINIQHLVLAQFDKVIRKKSKWKCNLKNVMVHTNDKDILFNSATGEFDF